MILPKRVSFKACYLANGRTGVFSVLILKMGTSADFADNNMVQILHGDTHLYCGVLCICARCWLELFLGPIFDTCAFKPPMTQKPTFSPWNCMCFDAASEYWVYKRFFNPQTQHPRGAAVNGSSDNRARQLCTHCLEKYSKFEITGVFEKDSARKKTWVKLPPYVHMWAFMQKQQQDTTQHRVMGVLSVWSVCFSRSLLSLPACKTLVQVLK